MFMTPLLAQIFIGWPAILGSLFTSSYGIAMNRPNFLIIGAVLSLGFAWYLTCWPLFIFEITGYSLPLLHLAAMFFVRYGLRWVAGLFLLPHITIALYLSVAVLVESH